LVDRLTAQVQAGEPIAWSEVARRHPEHLGELRRLWPALGALDDLSRSGPEELSGLGPPAVPEDGLAAGVLGDFRIMREVGRGGMGVVYEAEQISLRRRVALKVLPFAGALDAKQLKRFQNEAQAAAGLHHTNIVPVYFVGSERSVHFYAMQYIDGQTLAQVIAGLRRPAGATPTAAGLPPPASEDAAGANRPDPAPPGPAPETLAAIGVTTEPSHRAPGYFRAVARLGIQAAEALQHAHDLGVIHRDIKPGNLLIDGHGKIWVTDFGLARVQSEASLTLPGDVVGTVRYMSPEQSQANRMAIDHRTDVYSLGATLYELLTLRPAFEGSDRQELLRQIASEEPAAPGRLNKAVPAELETVVLKALDKRPEDRYGTAQELADDLERFLKYEPIRARRPSLVHRTRKWTRRHRIAVTASTICLLVMLAAVVGSVGWILADRVAREREDEEVKRRALQESFKWQQQGRIPEALAAARRAEELGKTGHVSPALDREAEARRADLELVAKLEEARLDVWTIAEGGHVGPVAVNALYASTFREFALDVEGLPVESASARVRESTAAAEIAAALDDWAVRRLFGPGPTDPRWKRLLQIARAADPDAWRGRMRRAMERKDAQTLTDLVKAKQTSSLPPQTLYVLAQFLWGLKQMRPAEVLLRQALRRYPGDFWLNVTVAKLLTDWEPPRAAEAIRFQQAAVALRPESPFCRVNLGLILHRSGRVDEAIAQYHEAIRLKKDSPQAYFNLGYALQTKKKWNEAIAAYRKAIELKPDFAGYYYNLACLFEDHGKLEEAAAVCRKAIAIGPISKCLLLLGNILQDQGKPREAAGFFRRYINARPRDPMGHYNLGNALRMLGKPGEAVAEFHKALKFGPKDADTYNNLGHALNDQGKLAEAEAAFNKAIRLQPGVLHYYTNLGIVLDHQGKLSQAEAVFRKATIIQPTSAGAHYCLGTVLGELGRFAEARDALRRAHELGSRTPGWRYPSSQRLAAMEQIMRLQTNLSKILDGQAQPANDAERIALAELCNRYKNRFAAAARFYAEAFAAQPALANDLKAQHRYSAACAAAQAAAGHGEDANNLDKRDRDRLRRQALAWLRADLEQYARIFEKGPPKALPAIEQRLQHWQQNTDLAGVRGEALSKLPQADRERWHKLWTDVADTLTRIQEKINQQQNPASK
jgi:serine/threonine protein kinase/Flp pilus assembly protein TadD